MPTIFLGSGPQYGLRSQSVRSLNNTQIQKLRYVENFYTYADEVKRPGALENAIGNLDMDALAGLLEGFFVTEHRSIQQREHAPKCVMRGNAVGKRQELSRP